MLQLQSRKKAEVPSDLINKKMAQLNISVSELFARAFVRGGSTRSASDQSCKIYLKTKKDKDIPEYVRVFCKLPAPECANPQCRKECDPVRSSRSSADGRDTQYFCSPECMSATPRVTAMPVAVESSDEGRKILDRVKRAMSDAVYIKIKPSLLRPMAGQPRVHFNPERLRRLANSMTDVGQMMPGIVRRMPRDGEGREYEILDGERRWRAVALAELGEYRAMLVEIDDEAAPYIVSVISNFHREGHTVLEISDAVVKMHEGLRLSMYEIANALELATPTEASQLYGLRRLVPEVRDMLDPNLIKGHPLPKTAAIHISTRPESEQLALARKMIKKEFTVSGLRAHVRSLDSARGTAPSRVVSPENRRTSILKRVFALHRAIMDMNRILEEPGVHHAIRGYDKSVIDELYKSLDVTEGEVRGYLKKIKSIYAQH